jgi:hypothetical protein
MAKVAARTAQQFMTPPTIAIPGVRLLGRRNG